MKHLVGRLIARTLENTPKWAFGVSATSILTAAFWLRVLISTSLKVQARLKSKVYEKAIWA